MSKAKASCWSTMTARTSPGWPRFWNLWGCGSRQPAMAPRLSTRCRATPVRMASTAL